MTQRPVWPRPVEAKGRYLRLTPDSGDRIDRDKP